MLAELVFLVGFIDSLYMRSTYKLYRPPLTAAKPKIIAHVGREGLVVPPHPKAGDYLFVAFP
jgi:hypothetical protein